jgi:hypothetical protein
MCFSGTGKEKTMFSEYNLFLSGFEKAEVWQFALTTIEEIEKSIPNAISDRHEEVYTIFRKAVEKKHNEIVEKKCDERRAKIRAQKIAAGIDPSMPKKKHEAWHL